MSQKKIIIFVISLFLLSSLYLFYTDQRDSNPDYQKNWWVVYFDDAKGLSWNFSLENHSDKNNFTYTVLDGENKVNAGEIIIKKGEARDINLDQTIGQIQNKKITVTVSDGAEKKEIYKNLGQ